MASVSRRRSAAAAAGSRSAGSLTRDETIIGPPDTVPDAASLLMARAATTKPPMGHLVRTGKPGASLCSPNDPSSAARPARTAANSRKRLCGPGPLQRLDTHHGLFASGILEVLSDKYPLTRRP